MEPATRRPSWPRRTTSSSSTTTRSRRPTGPASAAGSSTASTCSCASGASPAVRRARCCTTTPTHEQLGIIVRGRARLPHRRPGRDERVVLAAGRRLPRAARRAGTATASSSATTSSASAGSSTSSRPRGTTLPSEVSASERVDRTATGVSPSTSAARSPTSCCSTRRAARVVVDKTLTTPAAPLDGVRRGVTSLLRQGRRRAGRRSRAPDRPRHDADHQRADRGQDGRAAVVTTAGLRRHAARSATSTATTCTTSRSSSRRRPFHATLDVRARRADDWPTARSS